MSEVAYPSAFVDENSFKDFNTSFDTDDPLLNGNFEEDIASIDQITDFMNNTTTNDEDDATDAPLSNTPAVKLLSKNVSTDGVDERVGSDERNNQQRKSKYYAPVYVVRDRVSNTNPPQGEQKKKREQRAGGREKRVGREEITPRREKPRQIHRKDDEPIIEIKKKERNDEAPSRETFEQQRRMEEMRRAHEQEQLEREKRLREKEKERQDRERLQASRVPGERATLYDLITVQFIIGGTFEPGEVVLVPRTRGGFSYGRVVQHFVVNHCYADSSVPHSTYHWRIVYPSPGGGGNMFKDLPPAYIGKLVTSFNKDLVMPKDEDGERIVGDKPLGKDLNNAAFLPTSKFIPHQMVLVPRSAGGFTYGRIVKECTFTCRLDDAHKHEIPGWRVLVSGADDGPKVRKDVLAGNIGKIYIPEQLQAAMQAASEAANLSMATNGRRRVSPDSRDNTPTTNLTTVSPTSSLSLNYSHAVQQGSGEGSLVPTSPVNTSLSPTSPSFPSSAPAVIPSMVDPLGGNPSLDISGTSPIADKKQDESDSGEPAKPRGVLELPGNIFAKAQKDAHKPRNRNEHRNNNNNTPVGESSLSSKPLIVIDGPNVAMKHGKKNFSVKGINIALEYYRSRGFDAMAFVPEYFATRKAPQHQLGSSTLKLGDFMNSVGADDMPLLNTLVDLGLVVLTPPQDYDDSYSIQYARKHHACIVTNDRFNDNIDKQDTERERAQTRKFIRDHSISFTFVRDEFLPNPDFKFPVS